MDTVEKRVSSKPVSPAKREAALEAALTERNLIPTGAIERLVEHAEDKWLTANGASMVARAWTDPAYRARLLANGKEAAAEMGYGMPEHHRHLVVLENTPTVHNVIVCTLCSCTAFSIIGAPPHWYKDLEYRARMVRQSRTVLREMGLDLPDAIEIRVWDTTADTRYMVLPVQPPATAGWSAEKLAGIVTQESMIGTQRLDGVGAAR
jgi:nitrile hydratase